MNAHPRTFSMAPAERKAVPLLVGIVGPSGGGKTFSALRLATGIQQVTGGDIAVIDTENGRALHYADNFKFQHIPFAPPFGSLDYLAALQFAASSGAKVIVVDSMSHEHEGEGGMIDMHSKELDRMAGDDRRKRESMNFLAWQKPKQNRRLLINGILQMGANFIFCFRAKNAMKLMRVNGKTTPVQQGYMPIAGEEFVFEQTVNCLLPPGARGVPQWNPEYPGEQAMCKRPKQFENTFPDNEPLSEATGKKLAEWAAGGKSAPPVEPKRTAEDMRLEAIQYAERGMLALKTWWSSIGVADQKSVTAKYLNETLKPIAVQADAADLDADNATEAVGETGEDDAI